jgi:hypothetical protein
MIQKLVYIVLFIGLLSCNQTSAPESKSKIGLKSDSETENEVLPKIPDKTYPYEFDGDCANCRSFDTINDYVQYLIIASNDSGFLNIRSDASNFRSAYRKNIIGRVPCGTGVWGYGPLKDAKGSAGIAFAISLQDKSGVVCRGYISATGLKEIIHKE